MDKSYKTLSSLLEGLANVPEKQDRMITGVELDSRNVAAGDLFIAMAGAAGHGADYIDEAIQRGAVAVACDVAALLPVLPAEDLTVVRVANLSQCAGIIASRFYGNPSREMKVTGITGTNGKTTCSIILAQCLGELGAKPSVIGTIGTGSWGRLSPSTHTTPDAVSLQKLISEFHDSESDQLLMEVSSHGLEQGRVSGTRFHSAIFTNLSQDHLDYHGTMQDYAAAKARLFYDYDLEIAVINADDEFGRELLNGPVRAGKVVSYGLNSGDVTADNIDLHESGISMDVHSEWGTFHVDSELMGRFNISNLLACAALLLANGYDRSSVARVLSEAKSAPGRMERLHAHGITVVVDFAHTPDALEQVLLALRDHSCAHRLLCVFGCGGDRDPGKRPMMGGIAEQYADMVIVTDDNPRHEDPQRIRNDILSGMHVPAVVIGDRKQAIKTALEAARPGDIVLVAGKGHEQTQQVGDIKFPFSDRDVVTGFLRGLK